MLPVLQMGGSNAALERRARILCLAWNDVIGRSLKRLIDHFPDCCLPGQLLIEYMSQSLIAHIDESASNSVLQGGDTLRMIQTNLRAHAEIVSSSLVEFAATAHDSNRLRALQAVLELRKVLYAAPKGIVLP